ncbi:MAG: DUF1849 family protein [Xanthobacter sp.]
MPECMEAGYRDMLRTRLSALYGVLVCTLMLPLSVSAIAAPEVTPGKVQPRLLPHHATYRLQLESTDANSRLADLKGIIDYRITGNACSGYDTRTHQTSESLTDDGQTNRREIVADAWEAGDGNVFRFSSITTSSGEGGDRQEVSGRAARLDNGTVRVTVREPDQQAFAIDKPVLMPTEHVLHILEQAAVGPGAFSSRVYEGGNDPGKFYDTLAIIGRGQLVREPLVHKQVGQQKADKAGGRMSGAVLVPSARAQLEGRPYYPVSISYYDPSTSEEGPEYVMSFALYENGVIGKLRIDYGSFAVVGTMVGFEPLGDEKTGDVTTQACASDPARAL